VRGELTALCAAYCGAVDRRDGNGLLALFEPDETLVVRREGDEVTRFSGTAELAGVIGAVERYDVTKHGIVNAEFDLDGVAAAGNLAMEAHHLSRERSTDLVLHGGYRDRSQRGGEGRWRFRERILEIEWTEERPLGAAAAMVADRRLIEDLILRYCRGIDRLDREAVRACYHPDRTDAHTGFDGRRDETWTGSWRRCAGSTARCTSSATHLSEIEGDTARAETYALAFHRGTPRADQRLNFVSAFRYVDRLARRDGEWRIGARIAVREWTRTLAEGDWLVAEAAGPRATRDAGDPRYAAGFRRGPDQAGAGLGASTPRR
jgi:hypothetical protein